ncbi:MAG: ferrous iron transport protein A [Lachnospiraceae bacterium]|nr:ferrous iron transport protein A [Lachnospiraceae bacterium]
MLPLTLAKSGEELMVARIGGNSETKKHLEDLGFVVGARFMVITAAGDGNIIVNLKESRLAITKFMAEKIQVSPGKD